MYGVLWMQFFWKKLLICFGGLRNCCTFAPANEKQGPRRGVPEVPEARRKVVLWHNSIDRNCSTRETSTNRHSEKKWDTRPVRLLYTVLYIQNKKETVSEDTFTRFLGTKAEPSSLEFCWVTTEARTRFLEQKYCTMKSLILAQDER